MKRLPSFLQKDEVTVTPTEGYGSSGPIQGDSFTFQALFKGEHEMVVNSDGDEIVSSGRIFTSADINISVGDVIEVLGNKYDVLTVENHRDLLSGDFSHLEVVVG